MGVCRFAVALFAFVALALVAGRAHALTRDEIAAMVEPPYQLGEAVNDKGVHEIVNLDGAPAGYVFETEPLAPFPGFSGAPINVLVTLDREGRFINAELVSHNEPIFVSGLGQAPFHAFIAQYKGLSIHDAISITQPYGKKEAASGRVYLDGVTKATASVRIAHESIMAAAFAVAREKMQGLKTGPPPFPDPDYRETLTWDDLVREGIAKRFTVSNRAIDEAFAGSEWEDDDPQACAAPDEAYVDLWIVDLGPPAVAEAVLEPDSLKSLRSFLSVYGNDEPVLLIEAGRHPLVGEDFTRNTVPDRVSAEQNGLPVALRDSDRLIELKPGVPRGEALILRTDRRAGFDPTAEWTLQLTAVREHGSFMPTVGARVLATTYAMPARFYATAPGAEPPLPAWREALGNRAADVAVLAVFLAALCAALLLAMNRLAAHPRYPVIRLGVLAITTGFVGWWGQGQLSVATPLAVLRSAASGQSLAFLLYDPFSLLLWAVVIVSFVAWGRGLFCGWLCPFGAMQEFTAAAGRLLGIRRRTLPAAWDRRLVWLKYAILAAMALAALAVPSALDAMIEVEPFKTAVTTFFVREWWFVAYAVFWLALSTVLFKGFCRYVCPLGAAMALGGLLRGRDWIARRRECGSPCQLCRVKCAYGSIKKNGAIDYTECFACLDCVTIHDDARRCVPLVLAAKGRSL
ncbi:MAG TPA: 4Fe-4S binding protein [Rhizobiaceae bacterium]|nr:4Fe-4S binding protein [Rhizobiaceae bacterium]